MLAKIGIDLLQSKCITSSRTKMNVSVPYTSSEDESFSEFLSSHYSYRDTMTVDAWRHEEYPHLDREGHVCLDYTGIGLFSSSQRNPEANGGFGIGLSPTSANLATNAMYMEGGSTEGFFRKRILRYLSLEEDDYYIVFTANALSAFKLLAHSYPFHEAHNFLFAYDHICENVEAIAECAHVKGTNVQSVNLTSSPLRMDAEDLQKKLQRKRRLTSQKVANQGLFAYPYSSRVTGCKNSLQWIPEAQQCGWHVLLDVTSVEAKFSDSLGLALFSPDFLICSFYYVFGEDPTGFGCLLIKRHVLRTLGDSPRARAIGMVKIVAKPSSSSSPDEILESYICATHPHIQRLKEKPGHRRSRSMHGFSLHEELDICKNSDLTDKDGGFRVLPSDTKASSSRRQTSDTCVLQSDMGYIPSRPHIHGISIDMGFTCRGLDHADMLGYKGVAIRLRALSNWLVFSLLRLRHPQQDGIALVKIYSPMASVERGSSIAFTLSDSAGKVLDTKRVQMLADRHGISLGTGVIVGTVSFLDAREMVEELRNAGCMEFPNYKWRMKGETMQSVHVPVLYASLGFLNNFCDVHSLWLFVSRFLDPDFVSQELWHYQALNQKTIEI